MAPLNSVIQDLMRQFTGEEEIPLRCRSFTRAAVSDILRYGAFVGSRIECHRQILRGMDRARQLIHIAEEADLSFPSGTVILADEMLLSRGRFKRSWHAPQGGLWLTLAMVNTLLPENNLLVPMAAGIACCELLRHYGLPASIKWVNDVLVNGKKISGILTETFTGIRSGEEYVLVGIGINVNNDSFPTELRETATSCKSCLNREVNVTEMAARLLVKLCWNIGLLYHEEARHLERLGGIGRQHAMLPENPEAGEHLLLSSYRDLTDIFNRKVLFGYDVQAEPLFEARVLGLDRSGGLILELEDFSRITRHSGEITYLS